MSEPTLLPDILESVIAELAPNVLQELYGWKFCHHCGGLCNWGSAAFSHVGNNLICPHCRCHIAEWPPGLPIICDCGKDVTHDCMVLNGNPHSACCGLELIAEDEYSPDVPHDTLRIAQSCPGVERAEPSGGEAAPVLRHSDFGPSDQGRYSDDV